MGFAALAAQATLMTMFFKKKDPISSTISVPTPVIPSNPCSNIPVRCPQCPKGALSVWKYNMISHYTKKHSPSQAPAEFQISDFELEGLEMIWNN